jgi:hypothetical protein
MKPTCFAKHKHNNIIINNMWVSCLPTGRHHTIINKLLYDETNL